MLNLIHLKEIDKSLIHILKVCWINFWMAGSRKGQTSGVYVGTVDTQNTVRIVQSQPNSRVVIGTKESQVQHCSKSLVTCGALKAGWQCMVG